MTDQERLNYWYNRAKEAEAREAKAWVDGAEYAFYDVSGEGWNGEYFPDASKPINWTEHYKEWKKGQE